MKKHFDLCITIDGEDNDRTPTGRSYLASYALTEGDGQRLLGNETQVTGLTHDAVLGAILDAALDLMTEDIEKGE